MTGNEAELLLKTLQSFFRAHNIHFTSDCAPFLVSFFTSQGRDDFVWYFFWKKKKANSGANNVELGELLKIKEDYEQTLFENNSRHNPRKGIYSKINMAHIQTLVDENIFAFLEEDEYKYYRYLFFFLLKYPSLEIASLPSEYRYQGKVGKKSNLPEILPLKENTQTTYFFGRILEMSYSSKDSNIVYLLLECNQGKELFRGQTDIQSWVFAEIMMGEYVLFHVDRVKPIKSSSSFSRDMFLPKFSGKLQNIIKTKYFKTGAQLKKIKEIASAAIFENKVGEGILFFSDIHIGSMIHNKEIWEGVLTWIIENHEKYKITKLFFNGDLVEGIGCWPGQITTLEIPVLENQYKKFREDLKKLPPHLDIILQAGNHDTCVRLIEPQTVLPSEIQSFFGPNVSFRTNPFCFKLDNSLIFAYHGRRIDEWVNQFEKKTLFQPLEILKEMLNKQHILVRKKGIQLFPLRKGGLFLPFNIDLFLRGHIHQARRRQIEGTKLVFTSTRQNKKSMREYKKVPPTRGVLTLFYPKTKDLLSISICDPLVEEPYPL
jgi:UDP-2,3-diacylglucosamine pyrophosphatase LpxH